MQLASGDVFTNYVHDISKHIRPLVLRSVPDLDLVGIFTYSAATSFDARSFANGTSVTMLVAVTDHASFN